MATLDTLVGSPLEEAGLAVGPTVGATAT
jgi:hypothetical protein